MVILPLNHMFWYSVAEAILIDRHMLFYVGHPISSDNGLISQKLLRKSEFYYWLHVAMVVAY